MSDIRGRHAPAPGTPAEEAARSALRRAAGRARLALAWERLWPPLAGVGVVAAGFLAVSFAGLWEAVPALVRMAGVAAFLVLLALALRPFLRLTWPSEAEALARLDRDSGRAHRPATSLADSLATRPDDAVGAALWRAHVARALAAARGLKAALPAPGLARRDPRALRALAVLALVATVFMAPGAHLARLKAAFDWTTPVPPVPYRLDAWVDPPAYTGRAPIVLPGLRSEDATTLNATALQVPGGSILVVRGAGLDASSLALEGGIAAHAQEGAPDAGGTREQRYVISADASVTFTGPDNRQILWRFAVLPDAPPEIAFTRDPQAGPRNALQLAYRIEDDYGARDAEARFSALPPPPPLFPRPGRPAGEPAPRPLVAAPDFKLSLPPGGRSGSAQMNRDLVAHPWAGAEVGLKLAVTDEAGQTGESDTRTVRLPARTFTKPLARALIDERRRLAFNAQGRDRLITALNALTIAPEQFTPAAGEYLGLRTALARTTNARNDDDLRAVVDYLWEIALRIEDGDLSDAERALKAAQEALREALERGASDEEIRKLMQDLRAAMERMMRQLAEQAQRDSGTDARPLDPNTRIVRPQDLERMMDRLENLARSGSRDAARQLLDEMQAMMEAMRPGNRQAGQPQQGRQQGEIGKMIQEQQRLRDRTYRQGQENRQRGRQPGQQGEPGENSFGDLQQDQQELRRRLGQMLDEMRRQQGQGQQGKDGQQGEEGQQGEGGRGDAEARAGEAFGRAEQAMREAEEALGRGDGQGALDAEGRALQALRQGARSMAEAQRGNQPGEGMPGENAAGRTDPLGRPLRSQEYGEDSTVKVPDEVDAQRARRVLEELRRRLEQPERPRPELDYLERLLRGL